MKVRWCFDTSALVSLGHTDMIHQIIDSIEIVVSEGVIQELERISGIDDPDGASAKQWLDNSSSLTILKTERSPHAEDEIHGISLKEDIPLVTDDLAAVRLFQKDTICLFSVHAIYYLYAEGKIGREQAILSNERMRKERSWKYNLISILARTLYERSKEINR